MAVSGLPTRLRSMLGPIQRAARVRERNQTPPERLSAGALRQPRCGRAPVVNALSRLAQGASSCLVLDPSRPIRLVRCETALLDPIVALL